MPCSKAMRMVVAGRRGGPKRAHFSPNVPNFYGPIFVRYFVCLKYSRVGNGTPCSSSTVTAHMEPSSLRKLSKTNPMGPYLIFVIFFTQARFLENKIYTEERVNYDKWILRQNSVNRDLLGQANYKDQDYTKFVTHCV